MWYTDCKSCGRALIKIAVIGFSGAGKSTLARKLGERYGAAVLHLDNVRFAPNWVERDSETEQEMVTAFMDTHEAWVIDGNYRSMCLERRLQEADRIVLLLMNRVSCLLRAYRRARKFKGKTRPDMGDGCIEKFDREFVRWILRDGRTKDRQAWYQGIRQTYPEKCVVLKNQRQIDRFLQTL